MPGRAGLAGGRSPLEPRPVFRYLPRTVVRRRPTQAEKTAQSRRRMLDAALSCLIDRGYARTTTLEIADRAGLSRGSQLYHFPKKEALLTGALEYLFDLRFAEFREKVDKLPRDLRRWPAVIDLLWQMHQGPLFYAWLELVVASRTDPALRKSLAPVNKRLNDYIHKTFREIFEPAEDLVAGLETLTWTIFFVMFGMAVERSIGGFDKVRQILDVIESFATSATSRKGLPRW